MAAAFRRPANHREPRAGMGAQAFDAGRLTFANSSIPLQLDCGPDRCGQGETAGGDTIISLRHRTQRALVPTISQAGSPDTMSRRHFGQAYPATDAGKSYCGPT